MRKCNQNTKNKRYENFLKISNDIHSSKYNYSKVKYLNSKTKICIICPIHGEFQQIPQSHIKGKGCPKCGNCKAGEKRTNNIDDLIKRFNECHDFKYNYNLINYISMNDKLEIICPRHGIFRQLGTGHLRGKGCPKCSQRVSKAEIEIGKIISNLGYNILTNVRDIIEPLELDIYIPNLNKAIEFNGLYWHYSEKYFKPGKHGYKSNFCRKKGITLLHIREDLWIRNPENIKQVIIKFLNHGIKDE